MCCHGPLEIPGNAPKWDSSITVKLCIERLALATGITQSTRKDEILGLIVFNCHTYFLPNCPWGARRIHCWGTKESYSSTVANCSWGNCTEVQYAIPLNWRMHMCKIFKFGGRVDHTTHHVWPLFKVKRLKVKGIKSCNVPAARMLSILAKVLRQPGTLHRCRLAGLDRAATGHSTVLKSGRLTTF